MSIYEEDSRETMMEALLKRSSKGMSDLVTRRDQELKVRDLYVRNEMAPLSRCRSLNTTSVGCNTAICIVSLEVLDPLDW